SNPATLKLDGTTTPTTNSTGTTAPPPTVPVPAPAPHSPPARLPAPVISRSSGVDLSRVGGGSGDGGASIADGPFSQELPYGATPEAVVDHDRRQAGLRLPRGRDAPDVPAVADREQRQDADPGMFGGVHGAEHPVWGQPGGADDVGLDGPPERPRHERRGRQV